MPQDCSHPIVVVEDDEGLNQLLRRHLERAGFDTYSALNGAQALEVISGLKDKIVLLDYKLPDMDGKELLDKLLETEDHLPPFVVITGHGDEKLAVEMMKLGARDYVVKEQNLLQVLVTKMERVQIEVKNRLRLDQARQQLQERERQLELVLEGSELGTWDWDLQTDAVAFDQRWAKMKGYRLEEIVGHKSSWEGLVHPEDLPRVLAALEAHLRAETPVYEAEFRMRHKSGSWMWILDKGKVIERDAQGRAIRACGTHMDIDRRKQAEAELQQSREHYKALIETSPDMIGLIDETGRIITANPALCLSLGRDKTEIEGHSIYDLLPKDVADQRLKRGREAIERQGLVYFEDHREGRSFESHFIPIDLHREPRTFQGIARETTEMYQARNELQQTLEQLSRAFQGTINIVSRILEKRDAYTAGHQERVARLTKAIAQEMDLGPKRTQGLYFAAMVHDIGKVSIPAAILARPGKLSETEYNLVKGHPQTGYEILKDIEFPWPVAKIVLEHHERLDGSGYPQGLKGEEISLEARILAVADVVEAMSAHRPYRPKLGLEVALAQIEADQGTLFDPQVVAVCLRLCRQQGFDFS